MLARNCTLENLKNKAFLRANRLDATIRLSYHEYMAELLETKLNGVFEPLRNAGFSISVFANANRSEVKIRSNADLKSVLNTLKVAYIDENKYNTKKGVVFTYNIGYNTYI